MSRDTRKRLVKLARMIQWKKSGLIARCLFRLRHSAERDSINSSVMSRIAGRIVGGAPWRSWS